MTLHSFVLMVCSHRSFGSEVAENWAVALADLVKFVPSGSGEFFLHSHQRFYHFMIMRFHSRGLLYADIQLVKRKQ
jgi:hypothetical protein